MRQGPEWTAKVLKQFTANNSPDFDWLEKPGRHQFRWRTLRGKWITAKRRIKNHDSFIKAIGKDAALDTYVSTSQWLDPIDLPRLRDNEKPSPILLDHLVVFDIDVEPFSKTNLEKARKAAIELIEWIEENVSYLSLSHATFSGSKGFHIFYRDEDRSKFSIPNPKEREEEVRTQRKELLKEVIEAGHPVDPLVTPDTRRIIRLPGTIHGGTGWICTKVKIEDLEKPLKQWVHSIPKHDLAIRMPRWNLRFPKLNSKRENSIQKINKKSGYSIHLQVSTQVPGTSDRNVIMTRISGTSEQITKRIENIVSSLKKEGIGPCAVWTDQEGALIMVPRAIPNSMLEKNAKRMGIGKLGYSIKKKGHLWVNMNPSNLELMQDSLEPRGIYSLDEGKKSGHPWSNAHLHLAEQLGHSFSIVDGEIAGTPQVSSRIVKIR